MPIIDFTAEETNLIAIYKADTRAATVAGIAAAYPFMNSDFKEIARNAARKIRAMTGSEFSEQSFTLDDDTEGI